MPFWLRTWLFRLTAHIDFNGSLNSSTQFARPHLKILAAFVGYVVDTETMSSSRGPATGCANVAAATLTTAAATTKRTKRTRLISSP